MRRSFSLLLLALLAAFALTACASTDEVVPAEQAVPTSTPIPTAQAVARPTVVVQRGNVEDTLEFSGRWLPRDQFELSFEVGGSVRSVNVRRDDSVTAGQLIADLQIDDLERQLTSQQLSLETAELSLTSGTDSTLDSVTSAEIQLANAKLNLEAAQNNRPWTSVASAELNLQDAQRNLDNAQRAYDDAISRSDSSASVTTQAWQNLEAAKRNLRSSELSYSSAAQSYNNNDYNIKQLENAVIQAEINLENARAGGGNDPQAVQNVRSIQLQIDQINEQIRQSSLYAPFDGVVLDVSIQPGDSVQAYTAVISIGKPNPREIVATLAFSDVQTLNPEQIGVCQVANQPDTAVQCIIRRMPLTSTEADQTVRVAASMDDLASPGALIEVTMALEVRENVLWLPPSAIRTYQGRQFVLLQVPDGERRVDIETGLETDDRVEIISGLAEGEVVILP